MKFAPGEAQLLVYDPSGANHARLHVRFKEEASFGRVDVFADLEPAKAAGARHPGPTLAVVYLDRSSAPGLFNFSRHFQKGLNKPVEVVIASATPIGPTLRKEFLELGAASLVESFDEDEVFAACFKIWRDPTRFQPSRDPQPSVSADPRETSSSPGRRSQPLQLLPEKPLWEEEDSLRSHQLANPASSSSSHGIEGRSGAAREGAPPVFRGYIPPGEQHAAPGLRTPSGPNPLLAPTGPTPILRTPSRPIPLLTPTRPAPAPRPASGGGGTLAAIVVGAICVVGGVGFGLWASGSSAKPTPDAVAPSPSATPYDPPPPGAAPRYPTPTPPPPPRTAVPAASGGDVWANVAAPTLAPSPTPPPANARPPAPGTVTTIADIRANLDGWKNVPLTVEGVVTFAGGGYVPHRNQFQIQDPTGGLVVDDPDARGGAAPEEGDRVRVTGVLGDYRGAQQIRLGGPIMRMGKGVPPRPRVLDSPSAFSEAIEGTLVRFENARLVGGRVPENPANINLRVVTPAGEEVAIFLDMDTRICGFNLPEVFSVQGLLYQYAWTDASRDYVWIVYPRRQSDFEF